MNTACLMHNTIDSSTLLRKEVSYTRKTNREIISSHNQLIQESVFCCSEVKRHIQEVRSTIDRLKKHSQRVNTYLNIRAIELSQEEILEDEADKAAQDMLFHDIRNPVNNIVSLAHILKKHENLPEELKHLIDLVDEQSQKVMRLTQFHAIYQQLELGCYQPRKVRFNLVELLEKIQRYIQGQHYTNPVEIWVNGQSVEIARECMFFSDPQVMELMLQNLIQNAVEASPSYSAVRVEIQGRFEDEQPEADSISPITFISIHNEGMIPVAVQNRFFDKFATHGKAKGTGLGTYIAMLVAKSYGGTITFTTSEGHGTTLRVHLPGKLLI
uniref:histidine kinase n=1 Tax=Roseihalotalea indica TaxID=2867963 RepID=A0AA49GTJ8_9BACT|nr:HAMP domain-containing sensor histidine kinase [Tunicatimonas sp. TK19036]